MKRRELVWRRRLASAALGLMLAGLAAAQDGAPRPEPVPTEDYFLGDLPVVLTVSRLTQPLSDVPGAVSVIDRELIRASGVREIADLFRLIPGFHVTYANGANPVVTYHGLFDTQSSKRMQVLVDGRSIYSPFFFGGVNWNLISISIEDIDRIEVLRGSNSAAYGSNAFLGVANIITRDPTGAHMATGEVSSGSVDISDQRVRLGGHVGEVNYRLTAERRSDSGFEDVFDDKRITLANLHADLRLDERDDLEVQLGATDLDTGEEFAFGPQPLRAPRTQHGRNYFAQVRWRRVFAADEELWVRGYWSRETLDDSFGFDLDSVDSAPRIAAGLPQILPLDNGHQANRANLEFQHTRGLGGGARLVWGGEARRDTVKAPTLLGDGLRSLRFYRLFGNLEWRASADLLLNFGATIEHNDLASGHVAPRLMANYRLAPGHTLRVGWSRAYRAPSLFEEKANTRFASDGLLLDITFLSSGGLRPETVDAYELGYVAEYRPLGLTFDARLFREDVCNLIVSKEVPLAPGTELRPASIGGGFAIDQVNGPEVRMSGLEFQLGMKPFAGTRLGLAQSFVDIDAFAWPESGPLPPRQTIERSGPRRSTSVYWVQDLPLGLKLSAMFYAVGPVRLEQEVPGYERLDWRLAYPFRFAAGRGELALTVQNQFDPYAEFRNDFQFARRTFATLRLKF